ncbi:LytR C-terminal domain-containing protein [Aldersonia sp. NBC_00410]|uniref:LytR C-terminal domain-containing protein n=1 Tax=Aldersonia sp. NBC_00410 TaxID=2975954 RepID=UPI002257977B|nr:LytR C-terminal domain-containing protein [Aldersonia sp. NBC_00410]MCX5041931.1 LytR C-terminal domain-containing protein [Aldersonia sp. NBC_00410]
MSTPNPASSGPPLRALAMVLIALAILFAGLGALSWSSESDDDASAAAATTTAANTQPMASPRATTSVAPAAATTDEEADEASTTTTRSSAPTTTSGASATSTRASATSTASADVVSSVPVRVLNNSSVSGLAASTASELRGEGWTVSQTGNYSDTQIAQNTVYYGDGPGEKEAATMIAEQIGATTAPSTGGIGDGVTVILSGD